jgi:predicted DNA repair protein MutK
VAASGLLALFDDIILIMDDVATMSKVAAEKTAGIAGDDLAVNAEGLVGLQPSRELPILGKVALGSLANKVVLVPLALALPASVIQPMLMFGGLFLCYEGVHKVLHKVLPHDEHADEAHHEALKKALSAPTADDLAAVEAEKVKSAIITDIILSAEIVAVALGAIGEAEFAVRAATLSAVAVGMTLAIYGLVAVLVKTDDVGLWMQTKGGSSAAIGSMMVRSMPFIMRTLSVVGTLAMFLVGGGIIAHGFHLEAEHLLHDVHLPAALAWLAEHALPAVIGIVAGALAVGALEAGKAVWKRARPT